MNKQYVYKSVRGMEYSIALYEMNLVKKWEERENPRDWNSLMLMLALPLATCFDLYSH